MPMHTTFYVGGSLVEYLLSSKLKILDKSNEPTFMVSNGREVIDLTLGTDWMGNLVRNCHVSDEPSLSDQRYVLF
jgi:hypothetical protein